mgnify:FL=1
MRFWFILLYCLCVPIHASESNTSHFVVCYDFGCKSTQNIEFSQQQWSAIDSIFSKPALSAWLEKQQIRRVIALMEQYAGEKTGTHLDKAGNYPGYDIDKQQDCIDESTNTMQYLSALEQRGKLLWHELVGRKRRIVWLYTHWTAVIQQKDNGQLYAVDSWYRDNGEPPYIQRFDDWLAKASFPEKLNP